MTAVPKARRSRGLVFLVITPIVLSTFASFWPSVVTFCNTLRRPLRPQHLHGSLLRAVEAPCETTEVSEDVDGNEKSAAIDMQGSEPSESVHVQGNETSEDRWSEPVEYTPDYIETLGNKLGRNASGGDVLLASTGVELTLEGMAAFSGENLTALFPIQVKLAQALANASVEIPRVPMSGWPLAALAGLGVLDTGYLTYAKLSQSPVACPANAEACQTVLQSTWASVGPVPLAAIGLVAYGLILTLSFSEKLSDKSSEWLWWMCFSMVLASLGLMGVLIFQLHTPCIYCAASAFISAALLTTAEVGKARSKATAPRIAVLLMGGVTALSALRAGTLPVRAYANGDETFYGLSDRYKPDHPPVLSSSNRADIALAKHLTKVGAACYSAWWCPHCQEQREFFGKEAVAVAPFVECSSVSRRQLQECKDANIESYPTWIIDGKSYRGAQALVELANYTNFREFPWDALTKSEARDVEYIWGPSEDPPPSDDGDD